MAWPSIEDPMKTKRKMPKFYGPPPKLPQTEEPFQPPPTSSDADQQAAKQAAKDKAKEESLARTRSGEQYNPAADTGGGATPMPGTPGGDLLDNDKGENTVTGNGFALDPGEQVVVGDIANDLVDNYYADSGVERQEEMVTGTATDDMQDLVDAHVAADAPDEEMTRDEKIEAAKEESARKNAEGDMANAYVDPSSTGEEEAYINQRVLDALGQQQVEQRARMGRAGFGASGALAAMEADAMRQANLDAEGRIYDVREREQNQAFEQEMGRSDLDIRERQAENEAAILKAQMDAVNKLLDGDTNDPADADGDGTVSPEEADDAADQAGRHAQMETAESWGFGDAYGDGPPPDAEKYREWGADGFPVGSPTGQDDEYWYGMGLDGKLWKVRK